MRPLQHGDFGGRKPVARVPVSYRPRDVGRPQPAPLRTVPAAAAHSLAELIHSAAQLRAANQLSAAVDVLLYLLAFRCPDRQLWLALAETLQASGQARAAEWAFTAAGVTPSAEGEV